jgi:hypothetical protein
MVSLEKDMSVGDHPSRFPNIQENFAHPGPVGAVYSHGDILTLNTIVQREPLDGNTSSLITTLSA